jgi:hypothetical protein
LEIDEESGGKRWFSWWRECQRGLVLAATAGVDWRPRCGGNSEIFERDPFFQEGERFSKSERRERRNKKHEKKCYT